MYTIDMSFEKEGSPATVEEGNLSSPTSYTQQSLTEGLTSPKDTPDLEMLVTDGLTNIPVKEKKPQIKRKKSGPPLPGIRSDDYSLIESSEVPPQK